MALPIPLPPVALPEHLVGRYQEYVDGTRVAVEPRNAATVILLREAGAEPEVYLLRRQLSMDFAGGMAVFPGGGVDARDHGLEPSLWAGPSVAEWAARLGVEESDAVALVCAAVRETFEESGVLLAGESASSVVADTTGEEWEADRVALESRSLSLTDFLERRGLVLRTDLLNVWWAWVTPIFEPKRYATWFFVARLPEGQRTRDVSSESSEVMWLGARDAIAQAHAEQLAMLPPTYLTLLEISQHASVDAVQSAAPESVVMFMPELEERDGGWGLSMPDRVRPLVEGRSRA
ncbi:MAG TPA: NUDIX hydrolase [Nocardioides sp.]|nr:NUDIX hydrolase [Nocardioides sp.]